MTRVRTLDDIRFDALRNALYHTARRRRYEWLTQVMNFFVIVLGTAAFSNLLESVDVAAWLNMDNTVLNGLIGLGVVLVGFAATVFDFSGRAVTHRQFQKDFYRLLAEIARSQAAGEDRVAEFDSQLYELYATEPPVMRTADAKAYNDAIDAMGHNSKNRLKIPLQRSMLGELFPFYGREFKRKSESDD